MLLLSTNTMAQTTSGLINDILRNVNLYRTHHGLKPLILKSYISKEAQTHSIAMAKHKISFGHAGFEKRIKTIYAKTQNPNGAAENVAYNYKDGNDVVKNWLKSPHHLTNIKGNYNYTGIGIAKDTNGKLYFTQIFLKTKHSQSI